MIDKTLLNRYSVITKEGRGARRRAETFSATNLRNNDKHGEIERKNTFVITSDFSQTIHERNLRSLLRKVFHERGTSAIYERYYVVSFTFVARTWFTNVITLGVSYEGLCSWFTFVITYSVELNVSHGLRSPFNSHERGLGTEHGTNVELAIIKTRNNGTNLFYHSFYSLMVNSWMLFRISPWKGVHGKNSRNNDTVFYVQFLNLSIHFTNALRNNERGVIVRGWD